MVVLILLSGAMKPHAAELQWVRTPHQDRSRKTLERLLDTAEMLLQERGFDNVSVAEIAQAAGSSVGAFYARFRDKNGLLHHLHERFCEEAMATAEAALAPARWEGAGTEEILTAVIGFLEQNHRTRSGMFRAFLLVGHGDPRFQERERRLSEHVLARLTALLLQRRAEIGHPEPAFAIAFGMELVTGVLRERYVLGTHRLAMLPRAPAGIAPELVRAYCSYLGLAPRSAAGGPGALAAPVA
jgi:AcrR family transcriptional regulator